jgi:hypothetical protein
LDRTDLLRLATYLAIGAVDLGRTSGVAAAAIRMIALDEVAIGPLDRSPVGAGLEA